MSSPWATKPLEDAKMGGGKKGQMKEITLEQLLKAGAHFGHTKSHWHPRMQPFIFTTRENVHIIDLEKTLEHLKAAQQYAAELSSEGKKLLFLGTKRQVKGPVKAAAEKAGMPYVTERWMGGTITNFDTIFKQVKKLLNLEEGMAGNKFEKYTKFERQKMKEEIRKLNRSFGGIKKLKKLPDALFVIDIKEESTAIKEARKKGIPIIGTVDTNADPLLVDYPIPINDDAIKSVELLVNAMSDAIISSAKQSPEKKKTKQSPKEEKVLVEDAKTSNK